MLRKSKDEPQAEEQDLLSQLPVELIVKIFQFLNDEKNTSRLELALASPYFYDIFSEHFAHTLYGRSLRFAKWQQQEFKALVESVHSYCKQYEISLLSTENRTLFQNFVHFSMLAVMACAMGLMGGFIYRYFPKKEEINMDLLVNLFFTKNIIIPIAGLVLLFIVFQNAAGIGVDNMRHNQVLRHKPITQSDLLQLRIFINNHRLFPDTDLSALVLGTTTIAELLDFLGTQLDKANSYLNELVDYLQSKKRASQRYLNQNDFKILESKQPGLSRYAQNTSSLWFISNGRKESFMPVETESQPHYHLGN